MAKLTVPPLSLEELHLAIVAVAHAAESPRKLRRVRRELRFEEGRDASDVPSAAPFFRSMEAVLEAFSHAPEKGEAAIERLLLVGREVLIPAQVGHPFRNEVGR
jgi:hypothetical protein